MIYFSRENMHIHRAHPITFSSFRPKGDTHSFVYGSQGYKTVTSGDMSRSLMDSLPMTIGDWTRIELARVATLSNQRCHRPFSRPGNPSLDSLFQFLTEMNIVEYSLLSLPGILFNKKEVPPEGRKMAAHFPNENYIIHEVKRRVRGAPGVGTADPQATTARLRGPRPERSMGAACQVSLGHRTTRSTCRSCSVEDAGSDDQRHLTVICFLFSFWLGCILVTFLENIWPSSALCDELIFVADLYLSMSSKLRIYENKLR